MNKTEKHCLYAGIGKNEIQCLYSGMDGVDAMCSGYESCNQYKVGSRKHLQSITDRTKGIVK